MGLKGLGDVMGGTQGAVARAKEMAAAVYGGVMVAPQDYIGRSGPVVLDDRILVYVEGYDPFVSLEAQFERDGELGAKLLAAKTWEKQVAIQGAYEPGTRASLAASYNLFLEIIEFLRAGFGVDEVRGLIDSRQVWPCYALVTDQEELAGALKERYRFGRCEMDYSGVDLPGRVMLVCRVIPHEWGK